MKDHARHEQALAITLAGLAGYVDASGFGATGGFFVSFMSGNSTRLGVGLAQGGHGAALAGGLIGCFVAGVTAGALAGHAASRQRRAVLLGSISLLLAASATLGTLGALIPAACIMAAAMGAMNNIFEKQGQVSIPLTYMTGSLVKLGQAAASAILGTDRFGWVPHLALWLGFAAGVLCGAAMYRWSGLSALWFAAAAAAGLAALAKPGA